MDPLERSEGLWRDVYFRREKVAIEKRRVNRISKGTFGRPPYSKISVNRYDTVDVIECIEACNRRAEPVNGAAGVVGWLIIPGEIAMRGGRPDMRQPVPCQHLVAGSRRKLGGCRSAYAGLLGQRYVAGCALAMAASVASLI